MKYYENVDTKIENALFALMEHHDLSAITITQIVEKAKVSRASFYRNFGSRERIITKYIEGIVIDGYDIVQLNDSDALERLKDIFTMVKEEKTRLAILLKQGYGMGLLQLLNSRILEYVKRQKEDVCSGAVYIKIGAVFNLAVNWMLDDCSDEIEELCKIVTGTLRCMEVHSK